MGPFSFSFFYIIWVIKLDIKSLCDILFLYWKPLLWPVLISLILLFTFGIVGRILWGFLKFRMTFFSSFFIFTHPQNCGCLGEDQKDIPHSPVCHLIDIEIAWIFLYLGCVWKINIKMSEVDEQIEALTENLWNKENSQLRDQDNIPVPKPASQAVTPRLFRPDG